ncbi:CRISPR-associated exonuclease Cas4 [Pullulanibacillus pueri]|uniref:CRISPR-associated exonuclease Cas4 n=1 Tax=Pullulanibacillus pueri TaxID=1437324 RepID=A0A8J2ZV80_9BACL|nr:CRISPR-associated protein Cas4 [Pullulanibacillus pueri]MBM7682119.1 CRISPR-associated exonuclease Cas4 [Pullulanibacillus pueri]GGH79905.1 CRISPR-associated protein Cas4 [Pullulanibacillus pueri]
MMDSNEDDYLMLSGIQHFQFCKRQWALIHIEQQWAENVRTVEGQHLHRKADQPFIKEKRRNKLIVRALPIKSKELGATGICDVVEFIEDDDGVSVLNSDQLYIPIPVEYKRGKPKKDRSDTLQLTAQAMCLEEMLLCSVPTGYIFYNEIKHREEIPITEENKEKVRTVFKEMHHYFNNRHTPKVKTGAFCRNCSLQDICLPELMHKQSVASYIERILGE